MATCELVKEEKRSESLHLYKQHSVFTSMSFFTCFAIFSVHLGTHYSTVIYMILIYLFINY